MYLYIKSNYKQTGYGNISLRYLKDKLSGLLLMSKSILHAQTNNTLLDSIIICKHIEVLGVASTSNISASV